MEFSTVAWIPIKYNKMCGKIEKAQRMLYIRAYCNVTQDWKVQTIMVNEARSIR